MAAPKIHHNTLLLTQYYTQKQHQYFTNILNIIFNHEQMRDTKYIPPPQTIPLCHIHINDCNREDDITCTQYIIQIQFDTAQIYDNTGHHLITISKTRLK